MAIEGPAATVQLSTGQRLNGLNHIAELRAKVFGLNIERELKRFINEMRDPRHIDHKQNERALATIFFMAKIPAERLLVQQWMQDKGADHNVALNGDWRAYCRHDNKAAVTH